jgi:hypothetical protein
VGWWDYESPRPRDHDVLEAEQLHDMGLLSAVEIADLGIPQLAPARRR